MDNAEGVLGTVIKEPPGKCGCHFKRRANAAAYVGLYPWLRDIAAHRGYALAVHGSMSNDFDLVAIPWTSTADDPYALAEEMREMIGGQFHDRLPQPEIKPHGRLAWSIHCGGGPFIDLSIMPLSCHSDCQVAG